MFRSGNVGSTGCLPLLRGNVMKISINDWLDDWFDKVERKAFLKVFFPEKYARTYYCGTQYTMAPPAINNGRFQPSFGVNKAQGGSLNGNR